MKKKNDKENNKSDNTTAMLYFLSSICFYLVAAINFVNKDSSTGVIYICLGSTFLCLGTTFINKNKNKKK